jgi:hypothetical protein
MALRVGVGVRAGEAHRSRASLDTQSNVATGTPKEDVAERLAKRFGVSIGAGVTKVLLAVTPPRPQRRCVETLNAPE